jgi:type VI secretion system protein ImpK
MASFVETMVTQTMNLDLSKTLGGSRDITGLCTDLFLIVIRMREAEDLGDPAALRKLISYYISLFEKNCKAINVDAESINEAKYALVALLDETVLSIPGNCRDYWFTRPLQLDLFGDNIAGEEFFNKLQKLLVSPEKKKDILEIYYICLSLGFEGKYKIFNQEERAGLIDNLGRILRRTRVRVSGGLSPHGRRVDTGAVKKRKIGAVPFPLWLPGVISLVAIIVVWIILYSVNSSEFSRILETLKP